MATGKSLSAVLADLPSEARADIGALDTSAPDVYDFGTEIDIGSWIGSGIIEEFIEDLGTVGEYSAEFVEDVTPLREGFFQSVVSGVGATLGEFSEDIFGPDMSPAEAAAAAGISTLAYTRHPGAAAAVGLAAGGLQAFTQRGQEATTTMTMMRPGTLLPPKDMMVYIRTNTQTGLKYGKTIDGRMVYQKKDGSITVHRPERPIVLTRNPRLGTAARAAKRLRTFGKRLRKTPLKDFL